MRSHRSGADGVVGIDEVFKNAFLEGVPFSTTINASPYRARASRPSAPLKEASRLLLDVASTHPMSGGEWRTQIHPCFDAPSFTGSQAEAPSRVYGLRGSS